MTQEEAQRKADEWNKEHPIGTRFFTEQTYATILETTKPAKVSEFCGEFYPEIHGINLLDVRGAGAIFSDMRERKCNTLSD